MGLRCPLRGMYRLFARQWRGVGTSVRSPLVVFNTDVKAKQKARAALAGNADEFDYLRDEVASRVVDRICDMSRSFPRGLDLFSGSCHVLKALRDFKNKPGIKYLAHADMHPGLISRAKAKIPEISSEVDIDANQTFVFREDQIDSVPIEDNSLDLVVSSGALHWVNDLPGVLHRINGLLKPDGLFIGAMFGGETLRELRISMQIAEEELYSGVSPHVSPMVQLRDMASLLPGANFRLTTVDLDEICVPFKSMPAVMRHLKGMGENNAVAKRRLHYGRKAFSRAAEIYKDMFGYIDEQGRPCVRATFQIVHMIGWAPSNASQQPKPRRRGSATVSIADVGKMTAPSTE